MAKPDLIKWVTDDASAKINDPGLTKKLAGWLYTERPPFQYVNWLFNRIHKWLLGLQGSYFDIVVGSATQVTNLEATHVIADLDDTLVTTGTKILILSGTHTLAANLSLSNDDVSVISESSLSIIDVATFTFSLSGLRTKSKVRVINAGAGDIIVSGSGSEIVGIDMEISEFNTSAGVTAETIGSNAAKIMNSRVVDRFPSGTLMLFQQTTAPLDWTKDTTHNNKALRIVTGAVGSGGSRTFTTTFGTSKTTDSHTLSTSQIPSHTHGITGTSSDSIAGGQLKGNVSNSAYAFSTNSAGGGGGHTHELSDFDVQYVDFIIGVKN